MWFEWPEPFTKQTNKYIYILYMYIIKLQDLYDKQESNTLDPMFLPTDRLSFWKQIGLVTIPCISDLHTKLRIISRTFSSQANDSTCGIWGRGWNTYLLCWGPRLGLGFQTTFDVSVWYSWEVFFIDVLFLLFSFYITQVSPIRLFSPHTVLLWNSFLRLSTMHSHIP